ncbi:MAG: Hsp20/alpha crystallin family protein [Flavobacteriales bacterium]|nr:Hsp20/alpha crystallin family protein [Flavobacteriales bacterium]
MKASKLAPVRSLFNDTFFPTVLDSFFNELNKGEFESTLTPAAEVKETDENYIINLALAGMEKDDIKLDVHSNQLTVMAEKVEKKEEQNATYHLKEFRSGKYKRNFYLPEKANTDAINAELKNGILTITIDKVEKTAPKQITIK